MRIQDKVQVVPTPIQLEARDRSWLTLKELRELVREADQREWADTCLVSHGAGGGDHPRLRDLRTATRLVVTGPQQ